MSMLKDSGRGSNEPSLSPVLLLRRQRQEPASQSPSQSVNQLPRSEHAQRMTHASTDRDRDETSKAGRDGTGWGGAERWLAISCALTMWPVGRVASGRERSSRMDYYWTWRRGGEEG